MKKLNRKGFTLIELLAVIVVLAIVMVIAAASVLNSTRNAAINSFNSSALSVADYVKSQEQLYSFSNAEKCYNTWRKNATIGDNSPILGADDSNKDTITECFGLNNTDYDLKNSTINIPDSNADSSAVTVILCPKLNESSK